MRIIAFILSLLVFSMSLVPCSDGSTCDETANTERSHEHDHSDDQNDHCTPFCFCQCCGITVILPEVDPPPVYHEYEKYFAAFTYAFHYSYNNSNRIWHPPASG